MTLSRMAGFQLDLIKEVSMNLRFLGRREFLEFELLHRGGRLKAFRCSFDDRRMFLRGRLRGLEGRNGGKY